jgi:hypothetical protein
MVFLIHTFHLIKILTPSSCLPFLLHAPSISSCQPSQLNTFVVVMSLSDDDKQPFLESHSLISTAFLLCLQLKSGRLRSFHFPGFQLFEHIFNSFKLFWPRATTPQSSPESSYGFWYRSYERCERNRENPTETWSGSKLARQTVENLRTANSFWRPDNANLSLSGC